ncbi:NAC domain-containing protein 78 [Striga hermonthica]|uniref:NAC domain-containing protein 78 n=1 Tax=Striga hermonthica TaxID=68872 RepID=A0A9N7NGT1_STRHE|nr:NAC domain-containing protein 78 [Striga hermonthica]
MGKISNGFRFRPTDGECIAYLLGFVTGNSPPSHGFISIADLYGQTEPWELFENSEVKSRGCRYFFTKLKKVGAKKGRSYQRYSRNVGTCGGNWSNKGQKSDIIGPKGNIVGHSRTFRYQPRNSDDVGPTHGEWALKEYSLSEDTVLGLDEDRRDYVLCVLKKKKEKKTITSGGVQPVEADFDYLVATLAATSSDRRTPVEDDVAALETNEVMWPSVNESLPTMQTWTGVNDVPFASSSTQDGFLEHSIGFGEATEQEYCYDDQQLIQAMAVAGDKIEWPSGFDSLPTMHTLTGINDIMPPESCWPQVHDLGMLESVGFVEANNEDCSQNELATGGKGMWRSINERSPLHMWSRFGDDVSQGDIVVGRHQNDQVYVDNWLRANGKWVPQPARPVY